MRGYSAVGIINPKSEPNVGGALRAAHCYDAALVVMQGCRVRRQPSDTTKMARHVPLIQVEDIFSVVPEGCSTVAIEFIKDSTPLCGFIHPERAFYIFGPEDGNVPEEIVNRCDHVVFVPTSYCMNLAATVNVVLYDRLAKAQKRLFFFSHEDDQVESVELAADSAFNAA